jgi:hypothetical protein
VRLADYCAAVAEVLPANAVRDALIFGAASLLEVF